MAPFDPPVPTSKRPYAVYSAGQDPDDHTRRTGLETFKSRIADQHARNKIRFRQMLAQAKSRKKKGARMSPARNMTNKHQKHGRRLRHKNCTHSVALDSDSSSSDGSDSDSDIDAAFAFDSFDMAGPVDFESDSDSDEDPEHMTIEEPIEELIEEPLEPLEPLIDPPLIDALNPRRKAPANPADLGMLDLSSLNTIVRRSPGQFMANLILDKHRRRRQLRSRYLKDQSPLSEPDSEHLDSEVRSVKSNRKAKGKRKHVACDPSAAIVTPVSLPTTGESVGETRAEFLSGLSPLTPLAAFAPLKAYLPEPVHDQLRVLKKMIKDELEYYGWT